MTSIPSIVIVGGGFGGISCAQALADKLSGTAKVTLISDRPHFEYYAALYRVAAGGSPLEVSVPLEDAFAGKDIRVVQDRITSVDVASRLLQGEGGEEYSYDHLVLALGSESSFFGIPGVEGGTFTLKSLEDAMKLKRHLHETFEELKRAEGAERDAAGRIVVIGGGATGVELAGELAVYARKIAVTHGWQRGEIKIDLVEAMPRLMGMLPEKLSARILTRMQKLGVNVLLNCGVVKKEGDVLSLKDGEIRSKTVVWTAGVKAHRLLAAIPGLTADKRGRVEVDEHLRAKGNDRVYVIGDGAATQYAGMAQTAIRDAKYVARDIAARLKGGSFKPYAAVKPDAAVPAGPGWAAVVYKGMSFHGWIGWMMRRAADFKAFLMLLPPRPAVSAFLHGETTTETCETCTAAQRPSRFVRPA